jgi:predicted Zn-dependent protease with MMP-like domain
VRNAAARRRDRHGRGLRGPLAPPGLPLARSRAEAFDELVGEAVEHLEDRWHDELARVEIAVEDVPAVGGGDDGPRAVVASDDEELLEWDGIPVGRVRPTRRHTPGRIVVHRRPLELRAADLDDLAGLVHDVVVELVSRLLGLDPDVVDPGYATDDD